MYSCTCKFISVEKEGVGKYRFVVKYILLDFNFQVL